MPRRDARRDALEARAVELNFKAEPMTADDLAELQRIAAELSRPPHSTIRTRETTPMPKRFRKSDIRTHSDGFRPARPAVNVKVHSAPMTHEVQAHFKCSAEVAERANGFAWEAAQELFWEQMKEDIADLFGPGVRVYSEGRSGGWLVVDGLPDLDTWNAIMVAKWAKLVRWCASMIADLTHPDQWMENIDANRWAEEGAERYNFIDTKAGTKCLVDMHAAERDAREKFLRAEG